MLRMRGWLCLPLWLGVLALQGCSKMPSAMHVHTGKTSGVTYEDRVALGRYRPRAPTDPYVLALEHTVLQIMDSLRV